MATSVLVNVVGNADTAELLDKLLKTYGRTTGRTVQCQFGLASRLFRVVLLRNVLGSEESIRMSAHWGFGTCDYNRKCNMVVRIICRVQHFGMNAEMLPFITDVEERLASLLRSEHCLKRDYALQEALCKIICSAVLVGCPAATVDKAKAQLTHVGQSFLTRDLLCEIEKTIESSRWILGWTDLSVEDRLRRLRILLAAGAELDQIAPDVLFQYTLRILRRIHTSAPSLLAMDPNAQQLLQLLREYCPLSDQVQEHCRRECGEMVLRAFVVPGTGTAWVLAWQKRAKENLRSIAQSGRLGSDLSFQQDLAVDLSVAVGLGLKGPEVVQASAVCDRMLQHLVIGRHVAEVCRFGKAAISDAEIAMLSRWVSYGADLTQYVRHGLGDNDAWHTVLEIVAYEARPRCLEVSRLLAENGARVSMRAVITLLDMDSSRDAQAFWQDITRLQLEKALDFIQGASDYNVPSPPFGMLEWCTEAWRCKATTRRTHELQQWHAWFKQQVELWLERRYLIWVGDPWMGLLAPRLVAALAAGCRGHEVDQANTILNGDVEHDWGYLDNYELLRIGSALSECSDAEQAIVQDGLPSRILPFRSCRSRRLLDNDSDDEFERDEFRLGLTWEAAPWAPFGQ